MVKSKSPVLAAAAVCVALAAIRSWMVWLMGETLPVQWSGAGLPECGLTYRTRHAALQAATLLAKEVTRDERAAIAGPEATWSEYDRQCMAALRAARRRARAVA